MHTIKRLSPVTVIIGLILLLLCATQVAFAAETARPTGSEEQAQAVDKTPTSDGAQPATKTPTSDGAQPVTKTPTSDGAQPAAKESTAKGSETSSQSIEFKNPLPNITSLEGLLVTLLNVLIVLATPIVVIFIILAGFKYVTAQGDPGKIEEAKRALVYAIIGGVIIIGSVAIAEIIANTIKAF